MQIEVSNVCRIRAPTAAVKEWCRENLILPNPEYMKKSRMGFWTGNTPRTLSLYERHGDDLILPFGTLRTLPPELVRDAPCTSDFKPSETINYGEDVPLYPYQKEAVDAVLKAHYGILNSPAGSGKTQMGIAIVKKFGKRALWLTHTKDLLKQSKERAELYMSKDLIGTVTGGEVNLIDFVVAQSQREKSVSVSADFPEQHCRTLIAFDS